MDLILVRLSISQALSVRALDHGKRPVDVAAPEGDPVIVAEIKFREIAVQMFFFAALIIALHAGLK